MKAANAPRREPERGETKRTANKRVSLAVLLHFLTALGGGAGALAVSHHMDKTREAEITAMANELTVTASQLDWGNPSGEYVDLGGGDDSALAPATPEQVKFAAHFAAAITKHQHFRELFESFSNMERGLLARAFLDVLQANPDFDITDEEAVAAATVEDDVVERVRAHLPEVMQGLAEAYRAVLRQHHGKA